MENRFLTSVWQFDSKGTQIDDVAKKYKPSDRWGKVVGTSLVFYDQESQDCLFWLSCEGHGGLVMISDNGKYTNSREYKKAEGSFKVSISKNREIVFFEEDCDYSLLYNMLTDEQKEIAEQHRLKQHEDMEKLTNNYTEYKPLSYYAQKTIERYYPSITTNF